MKRYTLKRHEVNLQVYESKVQSNTSLLFLHGGPGIGAWSMIKQEAMQSLIAQYHCVFFDQRGSGLSFYPIEQEIHVLDLLEDVRCIALHIKEKTNGNRIVLCGVSFGGTLAMQCVDMYPELFDGIILSSTILMSKPEDALHFFNVLKQRYCEQGTPHIRKIVSVLDTLTPEAFFHHPKIKQMMFLKESPFVEMRYIAAMSDWIFRIPCEDILRRFTFPTLIMQGNQDCIAIEGNIIDMLVRLKNPFITYESFPLVSREISMDEPQNFVERMEQFLKEEFSCMS